MRRLLILTVRSVQEFGDDRCTHMAAAISYYALFSLFPLLIFMVSIFGIFLQSSSLQEDLIDKVLEFIPLTSGEGRNEVSDAIGAIAGISTDISNAMMAITTRSSINVNAFVRCAMTVPPGRKRRFSCAPDYPPVVVGATLGVYRLQAASVKRMHEQERSAQATRGRTQSPIP